MSSKSENTNVPAWWKDDLILDPYCKFTMEAVSFKAGKVNSKRHWNQVIAMMRQLLGVVITKSQCKTQFDVVSFVTVDYFCSFLFNLLLFHFHACRTRSSSIGKLPNLRQSIWKNTGGILMPSTLRLLLC